MQEQNTQDKAIFEQQIEDIKKQIRHRFYLFHAFTLIFAIAVSISHEHRLFGFYFLYILLLAATLTIAFIVKGINKIQQIENNQFSVNPEEYNIQNLWEYTQVGLVAISTVILSLSL